MNRAVQLAPILFALAGAGLGLCMGMLKHSRSPFQIHIEESLPAVILFGIVGGVIGFGVKLFEANRPEWGGIIGMATTALLGAAIAAPIGWITGAEDASVRLPRAETAKDVEHIPPIGMAIGAAVGCVAGLWLGWLQMFADRRGPGQNQVIQNEI